jgi:hypothetical protein
MWNYGGGVPNWFWWGKVRERENLEDLDIRWKDNVEMYV